MSALLYLFQTRNLMAKIESPSFFSLALFSVCFRQVDLGAGWIHGIGVGPLSSDYPFFGRGLTLLSFSLNESVMGMKL